MTAIYIFLILIAFMQIILPISSQNGKIYTSELDSSDFDNMFTTVVVFPTMSFSTSEDISSTGSSMISSFDTTSEMPFTTMVSTTSSSDTFLTSTGSIMPTSIPFTTATATTSSFTSSFTTTNSSSTTTTTNATTIPFTTTTTTTNATTIAFTTTTATSTTTVSPFATTTTTTSTATISPSATTTTTTSTATVSPFTTTTTTTATSSPTTTTATSTSTTVTSNSFIVTTTFTSSSFPTTIITSITTLTHTRDSTSTPSPTNSTVTSNQDTTVISIAVAACIIILLLICGSGIVVIVWVRKSKNSKSYNLQTDLSIENNNTSETSILLRSLSTSGKENSKRKTLKEGIFDHIPIILPISVTELPRYVHNLNNDEDAASDEFESLFAHSRVAPCDVSQQNSNIHKNRYTNILPFDDTRVILGSKGSFINANYIAGYNNANEYIATQGPLPHTIGDFWQMVFESGCNTIVMVTNPVEAGNLKCEVYWPDENEAMQCNNISINNIKETIKPSCTIREFVLSIPEKKTKSSSRLVTSKNCKQFHFTTWPDMGVPMDIATMLRFVKRVRANVTSTENPIVIHCSAGVGRTGTFIAIDVQLQRMQVSGDINVKEMVLQLRAQRASMIQTLPQYVFIYNCLLHEHLYGETEVNSNSIKEHFDHLLDMFPGTEDSRLEKEFEGANSIIHPDSSLLEAANDPDNVSKNREGAGIPLDLNRVHLNDPFSSGCDYINASYIGVFGRKAEFVMTQHPLKSTTEDFWRMMIERNFSTVVIIGNVKEEDVYWPVDEPLRINELEVRMVETEEEDVINVISLEIESEETEECVSVQLFHLLQWPRDEVPSSTKGILLLSQLVTEHSKGLVVVHSSSSIREQCVGVFCVIHSLSKRLNNGETVDVMGSTRRALQQRQGCIISTEQYEFIYEALVDSTTATSD